jgi:hypothetical protein
MRTNRPCPGCGRVTTGVARLPLQPIKINRDMLQCFCPGCRDWLVHRLYDLWYPEERLRQISASPAVAPQDVVV